MTEAEEEESTNWFDTAVPILRVEDMARSLKFYVDILGFEAADWGTETFTHLSRDNTGIYLCCGDQGKGGAWVWMSVADVDALYLHLQKAGVTVRHPPIFYPWAKEMQAEDPDGNVLRFATHHELTG